MKTTSLRQNLFEFFPDIVFYDQPVSDDTIAGVALIDDNGLTWVVAYDEYYLLSELEKSFSDVDEATEWYEYNVVGGYIGHTTPIFINFCENTARRFDNFYESVKTMADFERVEDAFNYVQSNDQGVVFVQLDQINYIENWL